MVDLFLISDETRQQVRYSGTTLINFGELYRKKKKSIKKLSKSNLSILECSQMIFKSILG